MTVIVTYDVVSNARRAKVATALQTWGERIQRSVFVCTVSPADLVEIKCRLGRIIDTSTDSVFVFRQCRPCKDAVETIGIGIPLPETPVCWMV